jgi:hypothetical protein
MSQSNTKKQEVFIVCPNPQCTRRDGADPEIILVSPAVEYYRVYTDEIEGCEVPVGSSDLDYTGGDCLECGHCKTRWNVPTKAKLIF